MLEAIVHKLPPPRGDAEAPTRALIFDAQYDTYRGVVLLCRVMEGTLRPGQRIRLMHSVKEFDIEEVGLLQLKKVKTKELAAGRRRLRHSQHQDREGHRHWRHDHRDGHDRRRSRYPGYKEAKPVVFSSMYPISTDEYEDLVKALDKLSLNDASLTYEKDSSVALGFGFRCGFLGLLHLDVVQERLEREYGLALLLSAPTVKYRFTLDSGEVVMIDNPSLYPDPDCISPVPRSPISRAR